MIEHATINEVRTAIDTGTVTVIDVREFHEYQSGHVAGSVHIPMHTIPLRTDEDYLPPLKAFFERREMRRLHA